jgi:hypothetical protein
VTLHETTIGRFVIEPGWRWSRDVGPIAGTRTCQVHHVGVVLKETLHLETDAGETFEYGAGDVYDIPPGHDAWVGGTETYEAIEFAGARVLAAPTDGERVLAALLITDIVDSTAQLKRLGDARGASSSWTTTIRRVSRSIVSGVARFKQRAMDFSPRSMGWRAPFVARAPSASPLPASALRYVPAFTRARWNFWPTMCGALPFTKLHVLRVPRSRAKCSFWPPRKSC